MKHRRELLQKLEDQPRKPVIGAKLFEKRKENI
jgi:hypothetical protein